MFKKAMVFLLMLTMILSATLFAACGKEKEYTVIFNGSGGTLVSGQEVQKVKNGEDVTPPIYTKVGYTLSWDGSFDNITSDITITAVWTSIPYTYIFVDWDGSVLKSEQSAYGNSITPPANPTKSATEQYTFTFVGWTPAIPNILTEAITFTAQYSQTVNQYTYTFFDHDGTTVLKRETVDYGTVIVAPSDPERPETAEYAYTFIGWDKEITGVITANISFKAQYSQTTRQYRATFETNGGSAVEPVTLFYNNALTLPTAPKKAAHTFAGWFLDNTLTTEFDYESLITADIKLYAKWEYGSKGLVYTPIKNNTEYSVTGYENYDDLEVHIPAIYNGKPVTSIGNDAFNGNLNLKGVVIAQGIKSIGEKAFNSCTEITSVTLPLGLTSIGNSAFHSCRELTSIILPNSLTTLSANAFDWCVKLESVTLSTGLTSIVENTFYYCVNLKSIEIPNGVTSIGLSAFGLCMELANLVLSDSVQNIGDYAFYSCEKLTNITIPSSVTSIGQRAFFGCVGLNNVVVLAEEPPVLGAGIFDGAHTSLVVIVPSNSLADYLASEGWSNYEERIVPSTVTATFDTDGGSVIAPITIPYNSALVAPFNPTKDSSEQYDFTFIAWSPAIPAILTQDMTFTAQYFKTVRQYSYIFLNWNGVELKIETADYGSAITPPANPTKNSTDQYDFTFIGWSPVVPDTLTENITFTAQYSQEVKQYTFTFLDWNGTILKEQTADYGSAIAAPYSPSRDSTPTHDFAFSGWTPSVPALLTADITFTAQYFQYVRYYTVTFVSNGGTAVASVSATYNSDLYPPTPPVRNGYAFEGWYTDINCTIMHDFETLVKESFTLYAKWERGTEGLEYNIISGKEEYEAYRYYGGASDIYIRRTYNGKPVTKIADGLFFDSYNLKSVDIPSTVTIIGNYAFSGCYQLASITIGNSVVNIGFNAFKDCRSLTSITIPNNVLNIGSGAFSGCSALASISLPFVGTSRNATSTVASFGYIFGTLEYAGSTVASQYPPDFGGMVNYYLPTSLKSVAVTDVNGLHLHSFYGCTKLETIIIPDGTTLIGDHMFRNCTSLVNFIIPESVLQIGIAAFYNCTSLTSIKIPNNVTLIRNYAFNYCANLTSMVIGANLATIEGNLAFASSGLQTIYCLAPSMPAGWIAGWNATEAIVYWSTDGTLRDYSFETNGGSAVATISALNVQSAPFTEKTDHLFVGWYNNFEFNGNPVTFPYFSKTNLTLYAKWERQCTYIFLDEDGFTEIKKQTVSYGSAIIAPTNPTKAATQQYSFTFTGWDKEIPDTITENITFTAVYCQTINKYTISFNSNGGSVVSAITQDYLTTVSEPIHPEKPGYIFQGWYIDNETFTLPYEFTTITQNITIFAKWTAHPGTEGLVYTLINGEYYVTDYTGIETDVIVPLMYNGLKVVCVYSLYTNYITSMVIGSNVKRIGNDAFAGCVNLNNIIMNDSVTEIGSGAFSGCISLNEVTIPNSVNRIGENAFYGCTNLVTVTLSSELTQITRGVFYHCDSLSEVYIGNKITLIDDMAFYACNNLSNIYYYGSAEQFSQIEILSGNYTFTNATLHCYE